MNKTNRKPVERSIFKIGDGKESFYLVDVSIRNKAGKRRFRQSKAPNLTVARTLREELKAALRKEMLSPPKITLEQFITNHYLAQLQERSRPSTFIRTRSCINANIISHLGSLDLRSLQTADIHNLLVSTLKHIKGQTKRHILASLRDICRLANLTGHLNFNPALSVPSPKLEKRNPLVLKEREVLSLLA